MISHKRKHDRQDGEQAYQQFKGKQEDPEEANSLDAFTSALPANGSCASASATSTPLSSLSTEHFLARKRGRPPKKIVSAASQHEVLSDPATDCSRSFPQQLPAESEAKRLKLEDADCNPMANLMPQGNPFSGVFYPGLLPTANFPSTAAAAAAAAAAATDATTPNFQMTHLMALFQLQNPLFYQNLYPGVPQHPSMLGNLAAFSAAAAAAAAGMQQQQQPKTDVSIKPEFKE